jgi:hypothetical protein
MGLMFTPANLKKLAVTAMIALETYVSNYTGEAGRTLTEVRLWGTCKIGVFIFDRDLASAQSLFQSKVLCSQFA